MKFLFILPGTVSVYGYRRDEFIWVEEYQAFVFKGKPTYPEQFNAVFKEVFDFHREDAPEIKCIVPSNPTPEELVSDAIVTLKHFAPDLLKPAKGRPPSKQPEPAMAGA